MEEVTIQRKPSLQAINVCQSATDSMRRTNEFEKAISERDKRGLDGPILFLSRERIRQNLRDLSQALPGVAIYYATKSNTHPTILSVVCEENHGFDVCSAKEIRACLQAGATTKDLLHTHPIKSEYEILAALELGITTFVVDNLDEIAKFQEFAGRVSLIVRYRAVGPEISSARVQCNLSYKFGCAPAETIELVWAIISSGIGYAGLAFHVGSQCEVADSYLQGINIASDIIAELEANGVTTKLLDIGGGFPVTYLEEMPDIGAFCAPIRRALQTLIPKSALVVCEPGRYISATSATLLVNIIGRSIRDGKPWYYLDEGVYGALSGRIYDNCSYRTLTNRNSSWIPSTLAGPTCDSIDIVYDNISLPPLTIGDTLVFPCLGAYSTVSASGFNSLRQTQIVVID